MRRREGSATTSPPPNRHPWIDAQLVHAAEERVTAGESVVFSGPAGSGAPLYVAAVEARVHADHPDLWSGVLWCPDATALTPAERSGVLDAVRQGTRPVVVGVPWLPHDTGSAIDPFETALTQAWLDGGTHRIDVGHLSDAALLRVMRELDSASHLPLMTRARIIAWSSGVRVVAQQLHAAALAAGPDVGAQHAAMSRPHLGSALFDAYASVLLPVTDREHPGRGYSAEAAPAGVLPTGDSDEAERPLGAAVFADIDHPHAPLARVAETLNALGHRTVISPDAAPAEAAETAEAPLPPDVAAVFDHVMAMDFTGAAEMARGILSLPSATPRERYFAAVAAGLCTAYNGSWAESSVLFERADVLSDVFPHDITGADELRGLWLESFARALSGADLGAVCARLVERAVAAARAGSVAEERSASALSACLHAMAGDAVAAELDLAAVSAGGHGDDPEWMLPMVRISVATCFALRGDTARAEELLQVSRGAAAGTPLVQWFVHVADTAVDHARNRSDGGVPRREADLLRTGRGGRLLEMHALFHVVSAKRRVPAAPEHVRRLHHLSTLVDSPVAEAVRLGRIAPAPARAPFLLWSGGNRLTHGPGDRAPSPAALLSEREREVAMLIAEGLSNRAIAERLYLSVRTVESHVYVARQKVGAATRKDLGALVAARAVA